MFRSCQSTIFETIKNWTIIMVKPILIYFFIFSNSLWSWFLLIMKNFFSNKYSNTWTAEKKLFLLSIHWFIFHIISFKPLKKLMKFFSHLQSWAKNSLQVSAVLLHITLIIELLDKGLKITFKLIKLRENYSNKVQFF